MSRPKTLTIAFSILFTIAVAMGVYQWQFGAQATSEYLQKQSSGSDSLEDYYNTAQSLGKSNEPAQATFLAVGDIMLSREVAQAMIKNNKDALLPFRNLDVLLKSTDFNFGNLESPFSGKDSLDPDPRTFTFNTPTWAVQGLKEYNFQMLSLANNHALNQGSEGLFYSKEYLLKNNLQSIGSGKNKDEAWQGQVISRNGINIGFLAATYGPESEYLANVNDTEKMQQAIADLKLRSDFVVVSMHAGTEYTRQPNWQQTAFAKSVVDAGADLVIGAHPHWTQGYELYNGKYIFYSLGNFIFDQGWSRDTKEGLTLKISVTKPNAQSQLQGNSSPATLKQIELIPVIIENNSTPRLANESEKESILKKIGATTSVITP